MTRDELRILIAALAHDQEDADMIMSAVDEHVDRETEAAYKLGYRQDVSYFARATRSFKE